jgi:hypothetical protein
MGGLGHAGQCGNGDLRWWRAEAELAAAQLAEKVDTPEQHLLEHLLGERVTLVLSNGVEINGVLTGWREIDKLPALLTITRGQRRCYVPWHACGLITPFQ